MEINKDREKKVNQAGHNTGSSSTALRIVELLNDPHTSAWKLSKVLKSDNALMDKILRIANSPILGSRGGISSVNYAIVRMGFDSFRTLMSCLMIGDAVRKFVDTYFNYQNFWNHSIGCGIVARMVSTRYGVGDPDVAWVAALLHDVGYLVLHERLKENFGTASKKIDLNMISSLPLEALIGVSHEEAGAQRIDGWMLSTEIAEAVRFHHMPQSAVENPVLTSIVHVSDVLCTQMGLGLEPFEKTLTFNTTALQTLNLSEEILDKEKFQMSSMDAGQNVEQMTAFQSLVFALKQELVNAIADLPEQEKVIIALHYYEGISIQDISKIICLETQQVEILHEKALSRLQDILRKKG
jgi:RNA polymerase sigma factor (sigma-70 family)